MRNIFCIFITVICLPVYLYAASSLSVVSVEGLTSIRFGRIENEPQSVQARVRITGDGQRFQLRQRLIDDFRNERGEPLDRGAVTFYALGGSNAHGTLYQTTPVTLDSSDRVLYASSSGDSDSLIIAYQIDPARITSSGDFSGRIMFTLQPVGSGGQEQNVIMNCSVTVQKRALFSVLTSAHSSRLLRFSPVPQRLQAEAQITLEAGLGKAYSITQTVEEPLKNEHGEPFPLDKIFFSGLAREGQSSVSGPVALGSRPVRVYSSTANGAADTIAFVYSLDTNTSDIPSGTFRGRISYAIDAGGAVITRLPLDVELTVEPIFEIKVSPQTSSGITFENIQAGVTIEKELSLEIISNRNKPYAVIQRITTPLTNERGDTMPLGALRVRSERFPDTPGETLLAAYAPIAAQDMNVFISDTKGSPARFIMRYSLAGPANVKAGNYFMKISFSLVEN